MTHNDAQIKILVVNKQNLYKVEEHWASKVPKTLAIYCQGKVNIKIVKNKNNWWRTTYGVLTCL